MLKIPTGEIAALIQDAGIGVADWNEVNTAVAEAIPGAMSALVCQSYQTGEVRFGSYAGIDDRLVDDYIQYYARCNPWNPYWAAAGSGTILDTIRQFPSSRYARSEFYNDWLTKLGDRRDDGIGIKLKTAHADMVFLSVQIPQRILNNHAERVRRFFGDLSGPLVQAIEMNKMLGERIDRAVVASTLLARVGTAAIVIDEGRLVLDINPKGEELVREAKILRLRAGRLALQPMEAQAWLVQALKSMRNIAVADGHRFQLFHDDAQVDLTIHALPDDHLAGYVFRKPLFLLQINSGENVRQRVNDALLAQRFGLSLAERNLCVLLAQSRSLSEAADELQITKGTARDRLKAIFRKTNTHRQAELVALLLRMGL